MFSLVAITCALNAAATDSSFYFNTSDGARLFVKLAGKGRPVLFVHGGPGSTSYYFEAQPAAALLEDELQMIYFDQRGAGRSGSAADYSLARLEKDIEELRTALGFSRWSVMGHSFAGIVIANYAAHHPNAVESLLMINGTVNMQQSMRSHIDYGIRILKPEQGSALLDTSRGLMERVGLVHGELTRQDLWYKLMFRNAWEKKLSDSITFTVQNFNFDFGQKVWQLPEYQQDFFATTAAVKCPVLVMAGMQDHAIGVDHYRQFRFPRQQTVKYIGGHAPFQEEPQWFAEKILAFMGKKRD